MILGVALAGMLFRWEVLGRCKMTSFTSLIFLQDVDQGILPYVPGRIDSRNGHADADDADSCRMMRICKMTSFGGVQAISLH